MPMELLIFPVWGIFLLLVWVIIIEPILSGLGGFAQALGKSLKEPEEIKCPMCKELIKRDAKVCKHCGHKIKSQDR